MKVDIGIIGAMEPEVEAIIATLEEKASETVSGITFYTGKIGEKTVAVAKCGIGKVFAALCAEIMILKYSPDLLVNTGVGGALASGITTGDIVIAGDLCQHDMDTSPIGDPVGLVSGINKIYFEADQKISQKLTNCVVALGGKALAGCIASGDQFVAAPEKKAYIKETFGAIACEMEGGAIAHVATVNGTPFAVLRAISDSADGDATMDYPTFTRLAAERSVATLRAYLRSL